MLFDNLLVVAYQNYILVFHVCHDLFACQLLLRENRQVELAHQQLLRHLHLCDHRVIQSSLDPSAVNNHGYRDVAYDGQVPGDQLDAGCCKVNVLKCHIAHVTVLNLDQGQDFVLRVVVLVLQFVGQEVLEVVQTLTGQFSSQLLAWTSLFFTW